MIKLSDLYQPKQRHSPIKGKLSPPRMASQAVALAMQRQEQIKKNSEEINKIIRQKKYYLKHQPNADEDHQFSLTSKLLQPSVDHSQFSNLKFQPDSPSMLPNQPSILKKRGLTLEPVADYRDTKVKHGEIAIKDEQIREQLRLPQFGSKRKNSDLERTDSSESKNGTAFYITPKKNGDLQHLQEQSASKPKFQLPALNIREISTRNLADRNRSMADPSRKTLLNSTPSEVSLLRKKSPQASAFGKKKMTLPPTLASPMVDLRNLAKMRQQSQMKQIDEGKTLSKNPTFANLIGVQDLDKFEDVLDSQINKKGMSRNPSIGDGLGNKGSLDLGSEFNSIQSQHESEGDHSQKFRSPSASVLKGSPEKSAQKGEYVEPNLNRYYSNTKKLITQAVKVLDGEKAYNQANLDQFLMGIKEIKMGAKPKQGHNQAHHHSYLYSKRNKLSKADESFYKQYSAYNDLSPERFDLTPQNVDKLGETFQYLKGLDSAKLKDHEYYQRRRSSKRLEQLQVIKRQESLKVQLDMLEHGDSSLRHQYKKADEDLIVRSPSKRNISEYLSVKSKQQVNKNLMMQIPMPEVPEDASVEKKLIDIYSKKVNLHPQQIYQHISQKQNNDDIMDLNISIQQHAQNQKDAFAQNLYQQKLEMYKLDQSGGSGSNSMASPMNIKEIIARQASMRLFSFGDQEEEEKKTEYKALKGGLYKGAKYTQGSIPSQGAKFAGGQIYGEQIPKPTEEEGPGELIKKPSLVKGSGDLNSTFQKNNQYFGQVMERWDEDEEQNAASKRNRDSFDSSPSKGEHEENDQKSYNRQFSAINDWMGKKNLVNHDQKNRDYIIEQWEEDDDLEIHNQQMVHAPVSRGGQRQRIEETSDDIDFHDLVDQNGDFSAGIRGQSRGRKAKKHLHTTPHQKKKH